MMATSGSGTSRPYLKNSRPQCPESGHTWSTVRRSPPMRHSANMCGGQEGVMDDAWVKYYIERGVPFLLHPPKKVSTELVAKFIAEKNTEFETLKELIKQEKDLIEIIRLFEAFLAENGFDEKKYSSGLIFFALCEAARSEIESTKH